MTRTPFQTLLDAAPALSVPLQSRSQQSVSSIDEANRELTVMALNSSDIYQFRWPLGEHFISADMQGANLERVNKGNPRLPFCDNHNLWTTSSKLGEILWGRVVGNELHLRLKFQDPAINRKADELFFDIVKGARPAFSVNLKFDKLHEDLEYRKNNPNSPPRIILDEWHIGEVSYVMIGACPDARVLSETPTPTPTPPAPRPPSDERLLGEHDFRALAREAFERVQQEESQRKELISTICGQYKLSDAVRQKMIDSRLEGNALYKMAADQMVLYPTYHHSTPDNPVDKIGDCVEAWLSARIDGRQFTDEVLAGPARRFAHHGKFVDMALAMAEAKNINTLGKDNNDIMLSAVSSTDFPLITERVINKKLAPMYELYPRTFMDFTRVRTDVTDFKQIDALYFDGLIRYRAVGEDADGARQGQFAEEKLSYFVKDYLAEMRITYRMMVNDDMNAITRNLTEGLLPAASLHQNRTVWSTIMANPMVSDGKTLFHADHGNYIAASGGPPSLDTLKDVLAKFDAMKTRAGDVIYNNEPNIIIAPSPVVIDLQIRPELSSAATTADVLNEQRFAKLLEDYKIIKVPELVDTTIPGNSDESWYVTASATNGTMYNAEIAFLNNKQVPVLRSDREFVNEGIHLVSNMRYGFAILEHRNWYKNIGG